MKRLFLGLLLIGMSCAQDPRERALQAGRAAEGAERTLVLSRCENVALMDNSGQLYRFCDYDVEDTIKADYESGLRRATPEEIKAYVDAKAYNELSLIQRLKLKLFGG